MLKNNQEAVIDSTDAIAAAGSLDNLILQNRILAVSPFSAFDDCSIGSHSINSSRSSRTRRIYESNVEIGSPTSHFSKRINVTSIPIENIDGNGKRSKKSML